MFIYVLRLENRKFYVGRSENVVQRYQEHHDGCGSAWTRAHKPLTLLKTMPCHSGFEEDMVTKQYMAKHGIENVRGGSYVAAQLSAAEKEILTRELRMAQNACLRCGRHGHFATACRAPPQEGRPKRPRQARAPARAPEPPPAARRCAYCVVHGLAAGSTFVGRLGDLCASCGRRLLIAKPPCHDRH